VRHPTTLRDLEAAFQEPEHAPTLHRIDEGHFQAQCNVCLRSSPVVCGEIEDALIRVTDLGWTTATPREMWSCPLCQGRASGRYAVP